MGKLPQKIYVKQDVPDDNDVLLAYKGFGETDFITGDVVGVYQRVSVHKVLITPTLLDLTHIAD